MLEKIILDMDQTEKDILYWSKRWRIHGYDWEDLVQELLIKLWLTRKKYNKKKASLRTWQGRIMRNFLIDLIKKTSRSKDALDKYPVSLEWLIKIEN